MSGQEHRDEMRELRALEPVDPPRELGDRVRRQAHAQLEAAAQGSFLHTATMAWNRVGLPAALTVTVVGYLAWAVSTTGALFQ